MNANGRGGVRAMALMLERIYDALNQLRDCEWFKENPAGGDGAPISSKHGVVSDKLEDACGNIWGAINLLREIAPNESDFE